jgi:7,8-dihydropterin-6-yl-methyl-4-(beta-D-ribofuranosyl)aminobenzene 5'-phosphate synthase
MNRSTPALNSAGWLLNMLWVAPAMVSRSASGISFGALIAHVAGRGLVVLTGCGHAGIINICRYAQRLTGVENLHTIIGGFHLTGPLFEPVIGDTVTALEQLAPEVIVPAHCTGWKATHAIARRLPGAFIQNSVGTTFHFTATAAA